MFVSIGELSKIIGLSITTLRRMHRSGFLEPEFRTPGGHRRYELSRALSLVRGDGPAAHAAAESIGYARVSSGRQKDDLERQKGRLSGHLTSLSLKYEIISDLGSGLNFKKRGLNYLISKILSGVKINLYVTHRDRLVRFGFELIEKLITFFGGRIIIIDEEKSLSEEEELSRDVLTIITVFSAKLYGKRSRRTKISEVSV
jgi:predicted site-specific integrase-resolvase